ncbi:MAG: Nif11 family protein [Leptolyngbya sp. SIO3F4]|nr:Nif11 family protein [Leptolyngbya sp. SIO3F4]
MSSPAIQNFNQTFAQSPGFQQKIGEVESLPQLVALLQEWDCNLTGPELVVLAQEAYQSWLASIDSAVRPFFVEAHNNKTLNKAIETCKNSNDVILLAKTHGFHLSEADLQAAAEAASKIKGFSFEKIWFKSLKLLP